MGRLILILLVGFGLLHLYANRGMAAGDPRRDTGSNGVVLLSAKWCGYCTALREDLDRSGAKYRELDVEASEEGAAAWDALGGRGVPITVVGQEVVHGYDPDGIRSLMQAAGHQLAKQ